MTSSQFLIRLCAAGIFSLASPCFAQLDRCFDAHGSVGKWQSLGSVEYDLTWEGGKGTRKDHQFFDLKSRDGLIAGAEYALGSNKGQVWIKPGLEALGGTPPRFYMWTPFYFFGMPFVFADPGATQESLGNKTFQGQEFVVTKVTFKSGTGDSPDDYYIGYVDPASGRLKLVEYVVTFASLRKGKALDQLERHAIVFEEWQQADGLLVPKVGRFYNWKDGNIEGEPLGKLSYSAVHFSTETPDRARFEKPADAVVAPLP